MQHKQNPYVLERCIGLLTELRQRFETEGFECERNSEILSELYDSLDWKPLRETLIDSYDTWLSTAEATEEERASEGYASPAECREIVLGQINREIRLLKTYQKTRALIESQRTKLEKLSREVPDGDRLERLLKYEGSLERAFDRTLNQLERLQRMRLGQAVPLPINVNLSS